MWIRDVFNAVGLSHWLPCGPLLGGSATVNDVHSQLNPTRVAQVVCPDNLRELLKEIAHANHKQAICIAGCRHAMGGQQFATDGLLLDTRRLDRLLSFDTERGLVTAEAGICWPQLMRRMQHVQEGRREQWGIAQKQTGADQLSLGGAVSANAHGRGLAMKPLIADVEALTLVNADGALVRCSREENAELFRLAVGGYGLFGVLYSITLRLTPRRKLQRVVRILDIKELITAFEKRIGHGFLYGDFQYMTDENSDGFLCTGVLSCYHPAPPRTPISNDQLRVSRRAWEELVYLAHADKSRAWRLYSDFYLKSSGQIYWSDTHQLGAYLDGYHTRLDRRLHASAPATEMITEINVPRADLTRFMRESAEDFRKHKVNIIYGTIRLIEPDDESFLAWARQPYACVIFNLHVEHTPKGIEAGIEAFRRLIDRAIPLGGTYYLTYHRWATRTQIEACYPQLQRFLELKREYDPEERFRSDWYDHYRRMFGGPHSMSIH